MESSPNTQPMKIQPNNNKSVPKMVKDDEPLPAFGSAQIRTVLIVLGILTAVFLSLFLMAATSVPPSYAGTGTVKSVVNTGKQCLVSVELEDGSVLSALPSFYNMVECMKIKEGDTYTIESGQLGEKVTEGK